MDIEFESMTVEDLNLIKENLLSDFDDFWNLEIFQQELANNNSYYIMAKTNSEIIGFGGIWLAVDEMHITNIVVKKDKRRMQIGSQILEKLIDITKEKEIKILTLEVNEKNIPAIELYKKYNFEQVGMRKNYYNYTDNALIMTLYL